MADVDTGKTLEQLEKDAWPEPEFGSHLVATCHGLRKKPVGELSVEDLRILLGQDIGSQYLLPLAKAILRADPLAEGDFFPGDLVVALLRHHGTDPEVRYFAREAASALRDRGAILPGPLVPW
jgi:hypothetical protein